MGWIRDFFTGGENERRVQERYPGPRDAEYWDEVRRGEGREGHEWRAAGDAFHWGSTRAWDAPASEHRRPGDYGSLRDTTDKPTWGAEGGGAWYQGDYSRTRGSGERRYGPYEQSQPTSYNWRTDSDASSVGPDPAYGYGTGNLFPPMRQPYGGATWTTESQGGYAVGESIYGRSVIRPDAAHRRRGPTAKNWRRSDDRIREAVSDKLMEHPQIDASDVDVEVENGRVTLRGTVDDRRKKYLIEDLCEEVLGVVEVDNLVRVQRREGREEHERYSLTARRFDES